MFLEGVMLHWLRIMKGHLLVVGMVNGGPLDQQRLMGTIKPIDGRGGHPCGFYEEA